MDIVYKEEQVSTIANNLNISKQDVNLIIVNYIHYLQEKLVSGETIKVLNICYIKNENERRDAKRETLGYIATELANLTGMGNVTVLRVLTSLEDMIIEDVRNGKGFCIRGLVRIRCIEDDNGVKRLRLRKSIKYNGFNVHVVTLNSFRRRVGV